MYIVKYIENDTGKKKIIKGNSWPLSMKTMPTLTKQSSEGQAEGTG